MKISGSFILALSLLAMASCDKAAGPSSSTVSDLGPGKLTEQQDTPSQPPAQTEAPQAKLSGEATKKNDEIMPSEENKNEQTYKNMSDKITKTDEEWRKELTSEQYRVLREHGT